MSDVQAGTPVPTPDGSGNPAGTPVVQQEVSGLNAQQQKEYLTLKQKAEDYNKLQAQLAEKDAQLQELARRAYGGGQAATDPYVEDIVAARQQAEFDPIARLALRSAQEVELAKAEAWLAKELMNVPEKRRGVVEDYIRSKGFSVGASYAMKALEDPETKTLAEQLEATKAELDRLKGAKANGHSPTFTPPATASKEETTDKVTPQEYAAILKQGGQRATELMAAVGSGRTRIVRE